MHISPPRPIRCCRHWHICTGDGLLKSSTLDHLSRISVRLCRHWFHCSSRQSPKTNQSQTTHPKTNHHKFHILNPPSRCSSKVREAEGSSGFVRAPSADGDDDDDGIDWINNGPYSRDDPKQMPVGENTASIGMLMKMATQRRQAEQVLMSLVLCCWASGFWRQCAEKVSATS